VADVVLDHELAGAVERIVDGDGWQIAGRHVARAHSVDAALGRAKQVAIADDAPPLLGPDDDDRFCAHAAANFVTPEAPFGHYPHGMSERLS
jgi:hypothetical protein